MKQVTINNTTKGAIPSPVGLIPAGTQRQINAADVTPGLQKFVVKTKEVKEQEPIALSLVEEIGSLAIGKAKERFNELNDEQLTQLEADENSHSDPRKGLLDAIQVEKLAREAAKDSDVEAETEAEEKTETETAETEAAETE